MKDNGYSVVEHKLDGTNEFINVHINRNGEPDVSIKYVETPVSFRIEVDAKDEFSDILQEVIDSISKVLEK